MVPKLEVRGAHVESRGVPIAAGQSSPPAPPVAFAEALRVWFKIGCLGFGGPAGQIALMHRILVDEKKWVEESRYLHALNFCMLLPGPEAQKLATYVGWLLHGVRGGLAAGILFVLPGALVMLGVSLLYVLGQGVPAVAGALFGIKAAVLVIVVEALLRIGRRALKGRLLVGLAALAFVGIFFLDLPFPLIVALAAAAGFLATTQSAAKTAPAPGRWQQAARYAAVGMALWIAPTALVLLTLGS
ncbi:MAG: chromate transporter, partial [Burkholderiales bacterium]